MLSGPEIVMMIEEYETQSILINMVVSTVQEIENPFSDTYKICLILMINL